MLAAFREKQSGAPEAANTASTIDDGDGAPPPKMRAGSESKAPAIQKVEKYVSPDSARIVISLSAPTTFRSGTLAENAEAGLPARMYLDIDNARFSGVTTTRHEGLVESIRIASHPHGSRIAIDLKYPAVRKVFYEPEPFRLVVDLARQSTVGLVHRTGARRVERIVLDPGHGGNDPGAIGPRGLREKDVTLDIAHRAAPIIARELGIATMLTRDIDDYVPLDERTAHANAFGADLFVSIHCNAAENNDSDGIVTFVLDGSSDAAAARIAALENSASAAASEELATAFRRIQDSAILERSVQFAQLLQRATVASLQGGYGHVSDKGVRRAGFYVLAGAVMPAVLFEVSFISNPDAEIRLNTGDYRQKLADAIVNAVRAYREGL
jgi:N-acetylmuramoyl-L-alanine amidase